MYRTRVHVIGGVIVDPSRGNGRPQTTGPDTTSAPFRSGDQTDRLRVIGLAETSTQRRKADRLPRFVLADEPGPRFTMTASDNEFASPKDKQGALIVSGLLVIVGDP